MEHSTGADHHDTHLPDINQVAAFSFRGSCSISGKTLAPRAAFTGLHETMRSHEHVSGHGVLLATFTSAGAAAFVRSPLEEFVGTTANLEDVMGRAANLDELHEQLATAPYHQERVHLLEGFLLARLSGTEPDPLVSAAVTWLVEASGVKRIDYLARYIGLSQSARERRFRRIVGLAPKKFASLVRLQQAVRLASTCPDLATVAHTAGYFDQSHFIHDFRRVTGTTPNSYFHRPVLPCR